MTSADQFQSHSNLTASTSSCTSFQSVLRRVCASRVARVFQSVLRLHVVRVVPERHTDPAGPCVEFVRVFQSVLRLHVVRVVPERHTGPASSCVSYPERLASSCCARFPDQEQDRKGKSNDGFVLYSRLRATSTHQRL